MELGPAGKTNPDRKGRLITPHGDMSPQAGNHAAAFTGWVRSVGSSENITRVLGKLSWLVCLTLGGTCPSLKKQNNSFTQ